MTGHADSAAEPPSIEELLKDSDWDARLQEARARRKAVLAAREAQGGGGLPSGVPPQAPAQALSPAYALPERGRAAPLAEDTVGAEPDKADAQQAPPPPVSAVSPAPEQVGAGAGAGRAARDLPLGAMAVGLACGIAIGLASGVGVVVGARFGSDQVAGVPQERIDGAAPGMAAAPAPIPAALPEARLTPPPVRTAPMQAAPAVPVARAVPQALALLPEPAARLAPPQRSSGPARPVQPPAIQPVPRGITAAVNPAAAVLRVYRAGSGDAAADFAAQSAALRAAGFAVPAPRAVPALAGPAEVRFFHTSDGDAARVAGFLAGLPVQDFTSYRPAPPPGTLEIWTPPG
ncbi:hypothetical protein DKT77_05755 [Meridianimarinicoccus roseus]|uniref:Uncharacterized protein n=1 Tax=Meridianimarinicoccus roseus TaxID=2072018 RepID=A0A2V2LE04_9RHOB|nr:hypothetical protein [Meridianimarinicoccus roseus]PWR03645.1 hypothetical protein DKT77_05755 [Meridianimarinicoccus roseus]